MCNKALGEYDINDGELYLFVIGDEFFAKTYRGLHDNCSNIQ